MICLRRGVTPIFVGVVFGSLIGVYLGIGVTLRTHAAEAPPQGGSSQEKKSYRAGDLHLGSSRVYVHVGKVGLGHEHAVEGRLREGEVRLGATKAAGRIVFDMATFVADTDGARRYIGLPGSTDANTQRQVNANMLGRDVLDVRRFPTAEFVVQSAKPVSEKSRRGLPQYQLDGEFTLHGVTQPIRILADLEEKDGWQHLRGGFSILQTQYGITPFSKAFGAIGVADQLTIWGDIWIAKDAAQSAQKD